MIRENSIKQKMNEIHFHNSKRSRYFLFLIIVLIMLGIGALIASYMFDINPKSITIFIFIDIFVIVLLGIYWYLQIKPLQFIYDGYNDRYYEEKFQSQLDSINDIEEALKIFELDNGDESTTYEYVTNRIEPLPISDDFLENEDRWGRLDKKVLSNSTKLKLFKAHLLTIKKRVANKNALIEEKAKALNSKESINGKSLERIESLIALATSRLKQEIEVLSKRANIYIAFGSSITIVAGIVLYFAVQDILNLYPLENNLKESVLTTVNISSVIIRISIVVFVEVFAFYYLRLYKNIVEDIKFYQNEITNIESKILSLYIAETEDSKKVIVAELAKTERNFILSNKQTTIELERRKHDSNLLNTSIDSIAKILKSSNS